MNIQQMMKQAQAMQKKMQEKQAEVEALEFEGSAAGAVKIIITGDKKVQSVEINEEFLNPEYKEDLEDAIILATNAAIRSIEATLDKELGALAPKGNGFGL